MVTVRPSIVKQEPTAFPPQGEPVPPSIDPTTLGIEAVFALVAEALLTVQKNTLPFSALRRTVANAQAALAVLEQQLHQVTPASLVSRQTDRC